MVSLGKVSAPKPVNLPSQRKENNGNDPTVDLVRKSVSGTWGSMSTNAVSPSVSSGNEATTTATTVAQPADTAATVAPARVIPAGPSPAWGGLGLPEERRRVLEQASREQQFPVLGADPREGTPHWGRDERGYDDAYRGQPYGYHHRGYGEAEQWDAEGPAAGPPYSRSFYEGGQESSRPPQGRRVIESQDFRHSGSYVVDRYVAPPPPPPRLQTVVPPPPPPPPRPALEREESPASEDSRLATVASSLPRSELSVGNAMAVESTASTHPVTHEPPHVLSPRSLQQSRPRILKRPEESATAVVHDASARQQQSGGASAVDQSTPELPSQASFLDHISSPVPVAPQVAVVAAPVAEAPPLRPSYVPPAYLTAIPHGVVGYQALPVWQPPVPMPHPVPLMTFGSVPVMKHESPPSVAAVEVPSTVEPLPAVSVPPPATANGAPPSVVSAAAEAQSAFMRAKAQESKARKATEKGGEEPKPPKKERSGKPKREKKQTKGDQAGLEAKPIAEQRTATAQKVGGGGRVLELRRPKAGAVPVATVTTVAATAEQTTEASNKGKQRRGGRHGKNGKPATSTGGGSTQEQRRPADQQSAEAIPQGGAGAKPSNKPRRPAGKPKVAKQENGGPAQTTDAQEKKKGDGDKKEAVSKDVAVPTKHETAPAQPKKQGAPTRPKKEGANPRPRKESAAPRPKKENSSTEPKKEGTAPPSKGPSSSTGKPRHRRPRAPSKANPDANGPQERHE